MPVYQIFQVFVHDSDHDFGKRHILRQQTGRIDVNVELLLFNFEEFAHRQLFVEVGLELARSGAARVLGQLVIERLLLLGWIEQRDSKDFHVERLLILDIERQIALVQREIIIAISDFTVFSIVDFQSRIGLRLPISISLVLSQSPDVNREHVLLVTLACDVHLVEVAVPDEFKVLDHPDDTVLGEWLAFVFAHIRDIHLAIVVEENSLPRFCLDAVLVFIDLVLFRQLKIGCLILDHDWISLI